MQSWCFLVMKLVECYTCNIVLLLSSEVLLLWQELHGTFNVSVVVALFLLAEDVGKLCFGDSVMIVLRQSGVSL